MLQLFRFEPYSCLFLSLPTLCRTIGIMQSISSFLILPSSVSFPVLHMQVEGWDPCLVSIAIVLRASFVVQPFKHSIYPVNIYRHQAARMGNFSIPFLRNKVQCGVNTKISQSLLTAGIAKFQASRTLLGDFTPSTMWKNRWNVYWERNSQKFTQFLSIQIGGNTRTFHLVSSFKLLKSRFHASCFYISITTIWLDCTSQFSGLVLLQYFHWFSLIFDKPFHFAACPFVGAVSVTFPFWDKISHFGKQMKSVQLRK